MIPVGSQPTTPFARSEREGWMAESVAFDPIGRVPRLGVSAVGAVLEASNVAVNFGGVRALVGVDLQVAEGQLVGLIGPNGAGKTTFIDAISGFVPSQGTVLLDGRDLAGRAPHERARRGLARTWQSIELFDDLTVGENLAVASHRPSGWAAFTEILSRPVGRQASADEALSRLGLESTVDAMPGDLSQGQRKLVGVARALAAQPRLICLDEPAAGLDTRESVDLGQRLRAVVDGGTSMLLVDHDMGLVLSISDYVVVLEFGKVIAHGLPDDVRNSPEVIAAYLGSAGADIAEAVP
jgi:branched-chain amino acid transport system ATP-binding protein